MLDDLGDHHLSDETGTPNHYALDHPNTLAQSEASHTGNLRWNTALYQAWPAVDQTGKALNAWKETK
jgi:hypothetical protein